jgi:hypothetical protein
LDLSAPELRTLIDQRFHPQFFPGSPRSTPDWFRDAQEHQRPAPRALTYRSNGNGR